MFRKLIFGIFILICTVITAQEIHIPKIPVYSTPMQNNSSQFYPPLYYVPHYIEFKAPVVGQEPKIYYPATIPGGIIIQQTYPTPTPMRNWFFGPKIYYDPNPVFIR